MPQTAPHQPPAPARIPPGTRAQLQLAEQDVLIIKPSSLGDIVHTLPAVALIKQHRPGWRLRWLVNPEWAPLLQGNPCLEPEGAVHFPRGEFRGLAGLPRLAHWLGQVRAGPLAGTSGIADFQGLARSALIGKWLGPRWMAGLADAREGAGLLYQVRVPVCPGEHAVRRYLRLAAALCEAPDLVDMPGEDLPFPLPAGEPIPAFVQYPPYVVLHPFSRGIGKSLTVAQTLDLTQRLPGYRIVVAGRCDPAQAQELATQLPAHAVSLLNATTLLQFIWLLRHASFTVSVDSGPMHIAASLGPRVLGIHTWSNPAQVGPLHPGAWVWKAGQILSAAACQDPAFECPTRQGPPDAAELRQIAEFTMAQLAQGTPPSLGNLQTSQE